LITDSPYETNDLVLSPLKGLTAGVIGAGIMSLIIYLSQPLSKISLVEVFSTFAKIILPSNLPMSFMQTMGFLFFALSGGIFGLLYALCQHKIPGLGLMFVGLFYGLILWIFGGLFGGWILGNSFRAIAHSMPFLISSLVYGVWLASASIWSMRGRSNITVVLPKD